MIDEGEKKYYVLIKDFNTLTYNHTLHRERKYFCRYCLEAFRTAVKLKCHIKGSFKINDKQTMKMLKKADRMKFKNFERKITPPCMIYADFESILVPEDIGKQNLDESYTKQISKTCCL